MRTMIENRDFSPSIQRLDSFGMPGEGPNPEDLIQTINTMLSRYERFFSALPENLKSLSLSDSNDSSWSVKFDYIKGGENTTPLLRVVILDNWNNKDRTIIQIRRPEVQENLGYVPIHVNDEIGHDRNTFRAIEITQKLTDELLGPFESTLPKIATEEEGYA